MDSIQAVIESLAQQLRRSVAVDDPNLSLIACSTHFDDADPARLGSLIARTTEGARRDYIFNYGTRTWRGPHRMAASPELGALRPRMCFPIRAARDELLGYIWVIEATPMSADEIALTSTVAEQVRDILLRSQLALESETREVEALVLALVAGDEPERQIAGADLLDLGWFRSAKQFSTLALVVDEDPDGLAGPSVTSLLRPALRRFHQVLTPRMVASCVTERESVVVIGHPAPVDIGWATGLATRLHSEIAGIETDLGARVRIGVGSVQPALADCRLAFDQAVQAARIAQRRRIAVEAWGADPLQSLLDAAIRPEIDHRLLPKVLHQVDAQEQSTLDVVETYLDLGGNVIATADRAHLHRTSVYYRLHRFEEVTGLSLQDGRTRLLLHLWLKVRGRFAS